MCIDDRLENISVIDYDFWLGMRDSKFSRFITELMIDRLLEIYVNIYIQKVSILYKIRSLDYKNYQSKFGYLSSNSTGTDLDFYKDCVKKRQLYFHSLISLVQLDYG